MDGVMDSVKERVNGRSKGLPWPTPYVVFAFEKCYKERERERKEEKKKRCAHLRDDIEIWEETEEKMSLVPGDGFIQIWSSFES